MLEWAQATMIEVPQLVTERIFSDRRGIHPRELESFPQFASNQIIVFDRP
jgi:hypothetical protein